MAVMVAVSISCGSIAEAAPVKRAARPVTAARKAVAKAAPKMTPVEFLVAGISINSVADDKALYSACSRANVKSLLWGLEAYSSNLKLTKSEFETAAAFEARAKRMEDLLAQDEDVIVCQDVSDNEDVSFAYDAERQQFDAAFDRDLRADLDWKKTGSYVSKTRMGASARVTSFFGIDYMIDMGPSLKDKKSACLDTGYGFGKVKFKVPIPLADAPATKAGAYLALRGRITKPFFDRTESSGNPTLDHPSDITQITMTAGFRLTAIDLVMPSNKVVWSCKIE
jgi:hypothetical protein